MAPKKQTSKPATGNRLKKTVYLDTAPDVADMLERACKTHVFSFLCVEALRDRLVLMGYGDKNFHGIIAKK